MDEQRFHMIFEINPEEIVDENAHAMSEAFDLPFDMNCLDQDAQNANPGDFLQLRRPISEFEAKAFGIKNPEIAFAMIMRPPGGLKFVKAIAVDPQNELGFFRRN